MDTEQDATTAEDPEYKVGPCHPPIHARFKPGNQASKGVTRGKNTAGVIAELKKLMKGKIPGDKQGRTGVQIFVAALFLNATRGNGTAIKQVLDRLEGPVPMEHSGPGGGPIAFEDMTPVQRKKRIDELITKRGSGTGELAGDGSAPADSA